MVDNKLICNFCDKTSEEVKKLINNKNVYICNECVELCYSILQTDENLDFDTDDIPSPEEIFNFLDQYVIGQDHAKKVLAVAVYKHYKRLKYSVVDDVEIEKSNILIVGPTGTGKTLLARTISRMLNVPFTIVDATSLTEAGYVGDDVENIISSLYQAADCDVEKTQRGIVYIDEIDKLARRGDSASITKDVGGEGVQQSLLKILEGTVCRVPPEGGRKHPTQEMIEIDTTNILFIIGGAFVDLDKIIEKDINIKFSTIGFGASLSDKEDEFVVNSELFDHLEPKHLYKFGLIPEFIGRIPIFSYVRTLSEEELIDILRKPKNAILKQYQKMFSIDDVELEFTDKALYEIVKKCLLLHTGARGLRRALEEVLIDIEFKLPNYSKEGIKKIIIDDDTVLGTGSPQMLK